ncbi:TFIIB-type zinc ribbon-containing protein [Comamonas thiooxydans]|uniref:TFIIB-type zinc ribbon-containing protein n=2 Tax=Comamonas thiooxydans TaxID=363952 RepID=A0AA42TMW6_9BURK|nr:TFIIB-type zinc ribbon-containing protein [Comamonas thiooxydans]MDH1333212.1 TFIIB-type zinc ribbon-containing protein [Comamonas thiooxydans]MDH1474573.1 TFIIB-type zinc ribbon-containing protein [Comamonas thiooxydans]MDH1739015.1 TFIIB-type zinc ribbon-containing protein [Comamonas thiooxydans]MDH1786082.1 TFIIB-type zinc ribbon-containing protein [Comamonas thiooxydans]
MATPASSARSSGSAFTPVSETAPPSMVGRHVCPECGGNLEWNAKAQSLKCPYCGTVVPWSEQTQPEPGRAVVEQDLADALRNPASGRGWGSDERYEVQCQNCRAISVFLGKNVAQRCDFCGSPAIVAHEERSDAITPQSILPFKISDGQIRDKIRQWYGSRWFAPSKLKSAALTDTLHGVYLPYWTFDAHASAQWWAEAGYYYYTTESYRDGNGNLQTRQVQHVRWEPASGSLQHFFDDELVPGTVGVHAHLLRQVEPFPTTTDLKPYSPEFVRGWTVERYQVDLSKAARINEEDMDSQLRSMCSREVPGDTQRNLQVQRQYSGRSFKHTLVPVWLVGYTYGSKTYQIVANGYTGQIAGERPYSWVKILFAVLAAILLVMLIAPLFVQQ